MVGATVTMAREVFYITIGIYIFAGILLVLLFFMSFWTPGVIFLRAKLQKKPLVYIINRSQGGRFAIGKVKSEGIMEVRGSGPYMLTENSHTIERKSNMPLFFAFGEFAATLPLRWVYTVNKIKSFFSKKPKEEITNVEDLGKKIGMVFDGKDKAWKKQEATEYEE